MYFVLIVLVSKPFPLHVDFVEIYWNEAVVVDDDDMKGLFNETACRLRVKLRK